MDHTVLDEGVVSESNPAEDDPAGRSSGVSRAGTGTGRGARARTGAGAGELPPPDPTTRIASLDTADSATQLIPKIVDADPPASPDDSATQLIPRIPDADLADPAGPAGPDEYDDEDEYADGYDDDHEYDSYDEPDAHAEPDEIDEPPPALPRRTRATPPGTAEPIPKLNLRLRLISGFGEILITLGLVLGCYVVYTLWWTTVTAHAAAHAETNSIEQQLHQEQQKQAADPAAPPPKTVFSPSEGFGLMSIPAIGVKDLPVMQGTDKDKVLNKGAVGHYTDPASAMPWDKTGNFAVAAHRRTYGDAFRYLNRLKPGDHVVLETSHGWYVYALDKELPQTDPSNVGVIAPIPKGGPYTKPGQYITLTTCTPEWASYYRLIWWGHLVRVDPLSGPVPPEAAGR